MGVWACPFCRIAERGRTDDGQLLTRDWGPVVAFPPLRPVTAGHLLVVPRQHVPDALIRPAITGMVFARAAEVAPYPCNLITSAGADATQTVPHLHVHVIPRTPHDGLHLPWTRHRGYRRGPA